MATDLTTVQDHPATLVERRATSMLPSRAAGAHDAATHLRVYEREQGVTFAALDNDALAAVREAYEGSGGDTPLRTSALIDLRDAVRDLLGLGD